METGQPISLQEYPRAILHLDGDAFFAAVEQAIHPELKGKPVVTGQERGIIACASYEAKAYGVTRGVTLAEARRKCPGLVILPSDYETYSLYSKRMFDIMRRYTPTVEEYSIDEGFADLTGLRRIFRTSYEEIALRIQQDIRSELEITVSVGLSLSKSLAKLASKFRKPAGFTAVPGYELHRFLPQIPLEKVWGFGPNTVSLLQKHGLKTAWDYVLRSENWAGHLLGKIGREIWNELRGNAVYPVTTEAKSNQYTLCKGKTFPTPSANRDEVYARLVRNVESAFIKLRRHKLRAREILVALRFQDFREVSVGARLQRATASTLEIVPVVRELFERIWREGARYRATMVVLGALEPDVGEQLELFEDPLRIEKWRKVSETIDAVNQERGKHKLSLGVSLFLSKNEHSGRAVLPWRKQALLPGENFRQRLAIPRLGIQV